MGMNFFSAVCGDVLVPVYFCAGVALFSSFRFFSKQNKHSLLFKYAFVAATAVSVAVAALLFPGLIYRASHHDGTYRPYDTRCTLFSSWSRRVEPFGLQADEAREQGF
jgi:hypothetical protein